VCVVAYAAPARLNISINDEEYVVQENRDIRQENTCEALLRCAAKSRIAGLTQLTIYHPGRANLQPNLLAGMALYICAEGN
jgi:hypothetical protein